MPKHPRIEFKLAYIFLPPVIAFLFYFPSLKYYFFQDDFYELLISKVTNIYEFINLFAFLENRSSYRPIGLQLYFFLNQTFFGLNPIFYRLVTFILFIGSYFLIIKCVAKMLDNKQAGFLAAFFWVTSSIHFLSLSWIAAAWIIIGTFFFFLALYLFLVFLDKNKWIYYFLSILFFLICVGSFEFFIAWPVVVFCYLLIFHKLKFKKSLILASPYIVVVFFYALARLALASLPQINEYKMELNTETAKNIFWYLLWSFNIPEELKKQVVNNLLGFNNTFMSEFGHIVYKSFSSALFILAVAVISLFKTKLNQGEKFKKVIIYSSIWFIASVSPVIIFPNHSFAMYLALPSIGVYMLIAYMLASSKLRYVVLSVMIVWLFSSASTLTFYRQIFWVTESQSFAKKFAQEIKEQYPSLPKSAVIFYPLQDERHKQAILNGNAAKILYNDPTVTLFFNEDLLNSEILKGSVNKEKVVYFYEK